MTRLSTTTVIACPHCQQPALKRSVTSFNTGHLTRWSDGFIDSWFRQPTFTRCGMCRGVYWISDATKLDEFPSETPLIKKRRLKWLSWFSGPDESQQSWLETIPESWKLARPVEHADIEGIAIGVEIFVDSTREQEQRMRRLLWWKLNDRHRNPDSTGLSTSESVHDNYETSNLLRLLELSNQDELPTIERVEIFRELGRFDEARTVLGRVNPDAPGIGIITQRIAEEDCRVCVIQDPVWSHREIM